MWKIHRWLWTVKSICIPSQTTHLERKVKNWTQTKISHFVKPWILLFCYSCKKMGKNLSSSKPSHWKLVSLFVISLILTYLDYLWYLFALYTTRNRIVIIYNYFHYTHWLTNWNSLFWLKDEQNQINDWPIHVISVM